MDQLRAGDMVVHNGCPELVVATEERKGPVLEEILHPGDLIAPLAARGIANGSPVYLWSTPVSSPSETQQMMRRLEASELVLVVAVSTMPGTFEAFVMTGNGELGYVTMWGLERVNER